MPMKSRVSGRSIVLVLFCLLMICGIASGDNVHVDYYTDGGGLRIPDVELQGSNVILDNDWFEDIVDTYLFMAMSSNRTINLKGIVVTKDMWDNGSVYPACAGKDEAQMVIDTCIAGDMTNIPTHYTCGSTRVLSDVNNAESTAGSSLIINEARQCTPEKPLLVFVGGNPTTVACALCLAPDIADKLIVFSLTYGHYNGNSSSTAVNVVCTRTRACNWAWHYFYSPGSCFSGGDARFNNLPPYPGEPQTPDQPGYEVKARLIELSHRNLVYINQMGDGPWAVWALNNACFSQARKLRMTGGANYTVVSGEPWDVLDVDGGENFGLMGQTFFDFMYQRSIYTGGSGPEAPSNVTAQYVGNAVNLSWQDNSSGDTQESGFVIERRPYGGVNDWSEVGTVNPDVTSYVDSYNLGGMVTYTYRIGAFD